MGRCNILEARCGLILVWAGNELSEELVLVIFLPALFSKEFRSEHKVVVESSTIAVPEMSMRYVAIANQAIVPNRKIKTRFPNMHLTKRVSSLKNAFARKVPFIIR